MCVIFSNHWLLYVYIFNPSCFHSSFAFRSQACMVSWSHGSLVSAPFPSPAAAPPLLRAWRVAFSPFCTSSVSFCPHGIWQLGVLFYSCFYCLLVEKIFCLSSVEESSADVRQPGTCARLWGDRWGNGVESTSTWSRIAQIVNSNMCIWAHMCLNEAGHCHWCQQADKQHAQIILM